MDSDPPKAGAPSKSGIGAPFRLPFLSRTLAGSASDARPSGGRTGVHADTLGEMHAAVDQLLQPKTNVADQRARIRFLIDTLMLDPAELEPMIDPAVATPLVSSLIVLCSRLLRDSHAHEIRVMTCELLTSILRFADVSTLSVKGELSKEASTATGWNAVMPSRALSMLDRALLYRLIVQLDKHEDWVEPRFSEDPEQAFHTLYAQYSALQALTREGRDILAFKGILKTLTKWLQNSFGAMIQLRTTELASMAAMSEQCTYALIGLLVSICKFNASRLDKEQMEHLLNGLCNLILFPRLPNVAPRKSGTRSRSNSVAERDAARANAAPAPCVGRNSIDDALDDQQYPPITETDARMLAKALDAIICYAFIPSECMQMSVVCICRVIGLPVLKAEKQKLVSGLVLRTLDLQLEQRMLLTNLLSSHFVHLVVRQLYNILCGPPCGPRSIRIGALLFLYATMVFDVHQRIEHPVKTQPIIPQSLFEDMMYGALQQDDDVLDLLCVYLMDDYLPEREACQEAGVLQHIPERVRQTPIPLHTLYDSGLSCWDLVPQFAVVMHRYLAGFSRDAEEISIAACVLHSLVVLLCSRTDKPIITMPFASMAFWPLASFLPDAILLQVIKENERQQLYLPSSPNWLENLMALSNTFYPTELGAGRALPLLRGRQYALQVLIKVYECIQDLPLLRDPMIEHLVVPTTERAARQETDLEIGVNLRRIMRHAMITSVCDVSIGGGRPFFDMLRGISDTVFRAELPGADAPQAMAQHSRQRSLGPHNVSDAMDSRLRLTRAMRSTHDLISLFMQLSFGITNSSDTVQEFDLSSKTKARLRECSLAIFRDLLRMVRSNAPFSSGSNDSGASNCVPPSLRLIILRWMLRMRADRQHRIYFQDHVEDFAKSLMHVLSKRDESAQEEAEGSTDTESRAVEIPIPSWCSLIWTVYAHADEQSADENVIFFPMSEYLRSILHILQTESDWDVLSTVILHLPSQLNNMHLFCGKRASAAICEIRNWLCPLLLEQKPLPNLVLPEHVRRTDLTAVLYATLKVLISYHRLFTRAQQDELVEAFVVGLSHSQTVAQLCVRALVVASYELSKSFTRQLTNILVKLSTIMSSITMSVHILELLAEVSSVQSLYANVTEADYRRVFGIALQYIQFHESAAAGTSREDLKLSPSKFVLAQYVLMLAYNNISQWFMTLRLSERPKHASFITQGLVVANEGRPALSDLTVVCLDFLARFTYSNTLPKPSRSLLHMLLDPKGMEPPSRGSTWIVGKGLVTIRSMVRNGTFEITVRRPSGTVSFVSRLENLQEDDRTAEERTADILAKAIDHWKTEGAIAKPVIRAPSESESADAAVSPEVSAPKPPAQEPDNPTPNRQSGVEPIFLALQFSAYPDRGNDMPPLLLPSDASTDRLLRAMDLTPVYDFHKIGLLYVGYNQTTEQEILSNTHGSMAYMRFLSCLGDLISLRGREDVYTGGLDRQSDEHGKYAYVWRDHSKQIVYHTSTLMPNHEHDVSRATKKALIGNDYVHIIFNDSGKPYEFGTIPSQFNFVNIIVSPHSSVRDGVDYAVSDDTYFHVLLQLKPGLPDFSPAGEGCLVSFATLPRFVRNLAMQSDIMSQIYLDTAESMVPFASNRVTRLHHVERFRQQLLSKRPETEAPPDSTAEYDFTRTLTK